MSYGYGPAQGAGGGGGATPTLSQVLAAGDEADATIKLQSDVAAAWSNSPTDVLTLDTYLERSGAGQLDLNASAGGAGDGTMRTATVRAGSVLAIQNGVGSSSELMRLYATGLFLGSTRQIFWSDQAFTSTGGVADVRLSRAASKVLKLTQDGSTSGASLELWEMSAPAAPGANGARLYCQDNGAGKTQLVVQFATGAAQVLATEP